MPFTSIFDSLPDSKQFLIINYAKEHSIQEASEIFCDEVGMKQESLKRRLTKLIHPTPKPISMSGADNNVNPLVGKHYGVKSSVKGKGEKEERKLNKAEKEFLKKLGEGTIGLEEASKFVATRVFEKMLKNPDDFRFVDFFRTELLKIKQEENNIKDSWGKEAIGRLFAGKLPPRNCPNCGFQLIEDIEVINGEEDDESLQLNADN